MYRSDALNFLEIVDNRDIVDLRFLIIFVSLIFEPKPAESNFKSSIARVGMLSKKGILVNRNQLGYKFVRFYHETLYGSSKVYRCDDLDSFRNRR